MSALDLINLKIRNAWSKRLKYENLTEPTETVKEVRTVPKSAFCFFEVSLNLTVHLMRREV